MDVIYEAKEKTKEQSLADFQQSSQQCTKVSVIILTYNEETFIARCIKSVNWADEIIVVDSDSTDNTVKIARSLGAKVFIQPWLGWLGQKAKAIELATHDWIFSIDADEIVSDKLASSLKDLQTKNLDPKDGYVVNRRDEFFGKLFYNLKRPSLQRSFVRMFNRQESRFDPQQIIHETVQVSGNYIILPGTLIHWRAFTVATQVKKYTEYCDLEAEMITATRKTIGVRWLVIQPILRFFWCYVRCGGWRFGTAGIVQASLAAIAEFTRYAAAWEKTLGDKAVHPPNEIIRRV